MLVTNRLKHFHILDIFRGLAAVLIVIFHINWINPLFNLNFIRNGHMMVTFFFVLSGFVVCCGYKNKIYKNSDLLSFMFGRFKRLYPLHLTMLVIFLLLECFKYIAQWKFGLYANHGAFIDNNLFALLLSVVLLHSVFPLKFPVFNMPSWTISTLFYSYLVFGLVLIFSKSKKVFISVCIGIVMVSLFLIYLHNYIPLYSPSKIINIGFIQCLAGFFSGVISYLIYERFSFIKPSKLKIYFCTFIMCVIIFLFLSQNFRGGNTVLFIPIVCLFIILAVFEQSSTDSHYISQNRFLLWLGKMSFSIYMVHYLVVYIYAQIIRLFIKAPVIDVPGIREPILYPTQSVGFVFLLLTIGTTLFLAYLANTYIEAPLFKKLNLINMKKITISNVDSDKEQLVTTNL